MTDNPTEVSDIDIEELKSVLLNRTRASRIEVEAYLNYCVYDQPLYLISNELEMKRSTVIDNISKVQSIIEDILVVSETVTELEDVGVDLRAVPDVIDADEPPQESAFVLKFNSTYLSHGGIDNKSYPCVNNTVSEDDTYEGGKGTDRFPFDLRHLIETDPDRAADLYAKITAKTYTDHIFADEYEQLVKAVSKHVLRSSSDLSDGISPLSTLHSDVSDILPELVAADATDGSFEPGLRRRIDEEVIKSDMGRKMPEIYTEHSRYWSTANLLTSDKYQLESYNLFFTSSDRRPFRTAAIFATIISRCLNAAENGPYKIIVQQGGWVADMLDFIGEIASEPEISKVVLIDDPVDGRSLDVDNAITELQESISGRVSVENATTPCDTGEREYIEITENKIIRSCWNKSI